MLFSYLKLKELAKLNEKISIDEVAEAINNIGFEVESIIDFQNVEGIKFGHVLKTYPNPDADNLTVCEIAFSDKKRIIQTTAKNVKQGAYLLAFVPGAKLGNIEINSKKLKGIISEGMLVSINELVKDFSLVRPSLNDEILLIDKVDLNLDPIKYYSLDDKIIDIKILTNRVDANSYQIMALELAAYFHANLHYQFENKKFNLWSELNLTSEYTKNFILLKSQQNIKISLHDQFLLIKSGIKTFNDAIDLTNLTLIMTGMPTHVYKASDIGNSVDVKLVSKNVEILGNKLVKLENNLSIVASEKVVSLAGVIGIEKFAIKDEDKSPFVYEIGIFDGDQIRKTMRQIKLETAASRQSLKTISDGTFRNALNFLAFYLGEVSVNKNIILTSEKINFNIKEVYNYLNQQNQKYDFSNAIKSLEILGFKFEKDYVVIPDYRYDIKIKEDMVEEILRFYNINNIDAVAPKLTTFKVKNYESFLLQLPTLGYHEVRTYSLVSSAKNWHNPFNFLSSNKLKTFVSKEREEIRNSLYQSLYEVIDYNKKRKIENISIAEIGIVNNSQRSLALASTVYSFAKMKNDISNLLKGFAFDFQAIEIDKMHNKEIIGIFSSQVFVGYLARANAEYSEYDFIIGEILIDKLTKKSTINSNYKSEPLKVIDINFELGLDKNYEEVAIKLAKLVDVFDYQIIDRFEKSDIAIITVRIWTTSQEAAKILKSIEFK